jgi:hypothetical protein
MERSVSFPEHEADTKEVRAVRSDGAMVGVSTFGPAEKGKYVRDLRFPDGTNVTIYEDIKAKVTWPKLSEGESRNMAERARFASADCGASMGFGTLLRRDQRDGQDVVVVQRADGSHRTTFWAAPKVGCQYLYVKSEAMQGNGSFKMSAETKATKIVIGEPEARLFEIAPDLVEMKPSEAQRKFFESLDLSPEMKAAVLRDVERENAAADKRYAGKTP